MSSIPFLAAFLTMFGCGLTAKGTENTEQALTRRHGETEARKPKNNRITSVPPC
jgi:hypothetical protein